MTQYDLGQVVGADGSDGDDGVGISSISKTSTSGLVDTYTITYDDGTTTTFNVTNGADGTDGTDGTDGDDGVGISSISKTGTSGLVDTYTITYTDSSTSTFTVTNGEKGDTGNTGATGKGISSITKTGTSGLVDTYTITYSDSTTSTFTVTNGSDATVTIQTSWGSTTSNSKVPSEKLVKDNLDGKSDTGHGHDDSAIEITDSEIMQDWGVTEQDGFNSEAYFLINEINTGLDGVLRTDNIANNLTTTTSGYVLDARQGKALADLIGDAITYINQ